MQLFNDRYIHELTPENILDILKDSAWRNDNQSITSSSTNDNDLAEPSELYTNIGENTSGPNAFADIQFDNVKRILDVGGGKYDSNKVYMKSRNIDLLVWDPYGRSAEHNHRVQTEVMTNKVKAATSMSILNVIPEAEVRLAHINTLKTALVMGGKAYFKIWPGEMPLKGSYLPSGTSSYYQANAYNDRFLEEIEMVFGIGNIAVDKTIPNLLVAIKKSDRTPSMQEIHQIQRKSTIAIANLAPKKHQAHADIYSSGLKLTLFGKSTDEFIMANRHQHPKLQQEYDKRYGLILL
jgi:hypothetical protein